MPGYKLNNQGYLICNTNDLIMGRVKKTKQKYNITIHVFKKNAKNIYQFIHLQNLFI